MEVPAISAQGDRDLTSRGESDHEFDDEMTLPDGTRLVRRFGEWMPVVGSGPSEPENDTTGCVVQLIVMFSLVVLLVVLLGWYIGRTGELPFTWADGPLGVPVWLPVLVLGLAIVLSVGLAVALARLHKTEPTFRDQIAANRRNSVFLSLAIAGGLGLTAYVIAALVTLRTSAGLVAAAVAIAAAFMGALVSLWRGDRIVLAVSQARRVEPAEQRELMDTVQELAIAADIPAPTIYLIDDSAPNAFSIGRDPRHASLAVTSGLLHMLDREQLQGVVAHELAHIRNEDTRYSLFVAVLAGSTVLVADGFFKVVTFPFQVTWSLVKELTDGGTASPGSGGTGSGGSWHFPSVRGGGDGGGGGGRDAGAALLVLVAVLIFVLLVIIVAWLVHVVTPVFDRIISAAVSRQREYLADATAVELNRNPRGLEQALIKVASSSDVLEVANRATAALYFVNPIRAFEDRAESMYATHPPILDRVNRLRQLEGEDALDSIPDAADVD